MLQHNIYTKSLLSNRLYFNLKLTEYEKDNKKLVTLNKLKDKEEVLQDLKLNLTTEEAKNDPYLNSSLEKVQQNKKELYLELIGKCTKKILK